MKKTVKAWAALDTPSHTEIVPFGEESGGAYRIFPSKTQAKTQNREKGAVVRCTITYELPHDQPK